LQHCRVHFAVPGTDLVISFRTPEQNYTCIFHHTGTKAPNIIPNCFPDLSSAAKSDQYMNLLSTLTRIYLLNL
jgi:hypothetical protein